MACMLSIAEQIQQDAITGKKKRFLRAQKQTCPVLFKKHRAR